MPVDEENGGDDVNVSGMYGLRLGPPQEDVVEVTDDVLTLDATAALVHSDGAGAITTFSGTTRNSFEGKNVLRLEYETYAPMALSELRKLCALARQSWPNLTRIALRHRIGVVPVGEISVVIAVSSVHRRESLDAASMLIDRLKETVPIW